MHSGNFVLVLHTHLPWVLHHGVWPHGVDWLNEAVSECYIPLMNVFNDLDAEGIKAKVTMDISPVLCEQLEHEDFKRIFLLYCDEKIAAAEKDEKAFRSRGYDPHHIWLTQFWRQWYLDRRQDFTDRYHSSVVGSLKNLQDRGVIEIATCGATHGYFPLLGTDNSINLQIKAAVENYKKHFGRHPRGIWLPECAYRPSYEWKSLIPVAPFHYPKLRPGVEQFLAAHDIEYFFTDENLIKRLSPIGVFTDGSKDKFVHVKSPGYKPKPNSFDKTPLSIYNVSSSEKVQYGTAAVFSRHHHIAMQVWSGTIGYPAEPDYLDFHKKHMESKLRYWRVTDSKADMMYKTLYHPDWTLDKLDHQANHFIHNCENTTNYYNNRKNKFATLCVPFDTELFGHWWFEGPEFIRHVLRGLHNSPYLTTATASEQLYRMEPDEVVSIPEGSWGEKNNHDVWSGYQTTWTWETIYNDENRLRAIYSKFPPDKITGTLRRIITQALREMMLMHASDWQFLIYTQSARDYSEQRFSYHHSDFNKLCDLAEKFSGTGTLEPDEENYLEETEQRNPVFPELELEWWRELTFNT